MLLKIEARKVGESHFRHVAASKVILLASDLDLKSTLVVCVRTWTRVAPGTPKFITHMTLDISDSNHISTENDSRESICSH